MEAEEETRDPLAIPSPEVLREIAAKQDAKALELQKKRTNETGRDERHDAAKVIQKNYRGYRERRALQGYGLDPSTRWMEV
jgi:hypothetical protein